MNIVDDISDVTDSEWTAPELAISSGIPWYLRPSMSVRSRLRRTKRLKPKLEKGIYGIRKRCLYAMVLIAVGSAVVNMSLLIWIIKVLDMTQFGLGKLQVVEKGLEVDEDVEFRHFLTAEKIGWKEALTVDSSRILTLSSKNVNRPGNSIVLGESSVEFTNKNLRVYDKKKKCVFETGKNLVGYNVSGIVLSGDGGIEIKKSLVTKLVRSVRELRLESPRSRVDVTGPEGVDLVSKAGALSIRCSDDVRIQAKKGTITVDTPELRFGGLEVTDGGEKSPQQTFDVCVCDNGRVFLAEPNGFCQAGDWVCKD